MVTIVLIFRSRSTRENDITSQSFIRAFTELSFSIEISTMRCCIALADRGRSHIDRELVYRLRNARDMKYLASDRPQPLFQNWTIPASIRQITGEVDFTYCQ